MMTSTVGDGTVSPDAPPVVGRGWGWIMAYGLLSVVIGMLAFAWPFAATFAATLVIGAFFIASGIASIGAGVFGKGHEGRLYAIAFGLLSLIVGVYLAFAPGAGALSLTVMVAIWLGLRGALEIALGVRFRRNRGLMIVLGLLNVALALIVLATLPWSALTLPGYILGLSFLFGGITSIMAATHHRAGAAAFGLPR